MYFPPEIGVKGGPQRRQGVVRVHHHMHEAVEEGEQCDGRHVEPVPDGHPPQYGHHRVVVEVKGRDLRVLLAQHEEHGVQEVHEFGDVVQVEGPDLVLNGQRVVVFGRESEVQKS